MWKLCLVILIVWLYRGLVFWVWFIFLYFLVKEFRFVASFGCIVLFVFLRMVFVFLYWWSVLRFLLCVFRIFVRYIWCIVRLGWFCSKSCVFTSSVFVYKVFVWLKLCNFKCIDVKLFNFLVVLWCKFLNFDLVMLSVLMNVCFVFSGFFSLRRIRACSVNTLARSFKSNGWLFELVIYFIFFVMFL